MANASCVDELPPPPVCDASAAFSSPEPLSELAAPDSRESSLVLSTSDENMAIFSSQRAGDRGATLYTARRPNRARLFQAPEKLSIDVAGTAPTLSADGLTLYFVHDARLFRASRASKDAAFDTPADLAIDASCAALDETHDRLWYTDASAKTYEQALGNPKASRVAHPELDGYACLVLSRDGTSAFVRKGSSVHRTSRDDSGKWSAPAVVPELGDAEPSYLSANQCDLYLTSKRDGVERIYWAKRAP